MRAPVALVSFNRPTATRRTLDRIREAAPPELLLIADGPRPGNEDDPAKCAEVRRELEAIDWPCRVSRRYSDENRGLEPTIESGLDWVFEEVEEAIILEDDCLPTADFFRFCDELLDRYRTTEDVWQIAGRAAPVPVEAFGGASYAFTALGPIWGWATWRRAWTRHRGGSARPGHEGAGSKLQTRAARRYFKDVERDVEGASFSWDSRWCLSLTRAGALAVLPAANLIEMIGFGQDATNTTTPVPHRAPEPMEWPLSHPAGVAVDPEIERTLERVLVSYQGRAVRFAARLLGQGGLGQAVQSAVNAWRGRQFGTP
jgi:hypothetical protein